MESFNIFVYGTLLSGEGNHHVAAPYILKRKPGKVKGTLYHVGAFPALVLEGENEIKGEWFTVTREGLKNMDWLEGYEEGGQFNHYERTRVKDIDTELEGFVYVYSKEQANGLQVISSCDWRNK